MRIRGNRTELVYSQKLMAEFNSCEIELEYDFTEMHIIEAHEYMSYLNILQNVKQDLINKHVLKITSFVW